MGKGSGYCNGVRGKGTTLWAQGAWRSGFKVAGFMPTHYKPQKRIDETNAFCLRLGGGFGHWIRVMGSGARDQGYGFNVFGVYGLRFWVLCNYRKEQMKQTNWFSV